MQTVPAADERGLERQLPSDDASTARDASSDGCNPAVSPHLIDFLARWLDGGQFANEVWPDQRSEALSTTLRTMRERAGWRLERITTHQVARNTIEDAWRIFAELCRGQSAALAEIHERFEFIAVVGIPRTGGSYLTAELFASLGYDPGSVPGAIAHDGFPDAGPFSMSPGGNRWLNSLLSVSEYLALMKLYFSARPTPGRTVVPKKLTKAVYAGQLFRRILGPRANFLLTVRHPIACCVSTYEKSGGLPAERRFAARSAIERWIRRDLLMTGMDASQLADLDYFAAYVRYWEQFHINLAMSGLVANREYSVVPYGTQFMHQTAEMFRDRFGADRPVSQFVAGTAYDEKHPEWVARSAVAIERVAAVWQLVGIRFPTQAVLLCH